MKWTIGDLGSICELSYGKNLPKETRKEGEYPVFGSAGIVDYHSEPFVLEPSIIVGRKGSIGKIYFSNTPCCPIDTVYYITENEKIHLRFLYYYLHTLGLEYLNTDAAVPGLNRNNAYKQKVRIPEKSFQQKIASILSAYDNLIENNTKRIKLLEEAAQNIYKEWFVHFRFPGYEKAKFENGLPKGWRKDKAGNLINIVKGRKPQNELDNPSPTSQLYLLVDVLERKMLRYTEDEKLPQCEFGETLMLMDGSRSGAVFKGINGAIGSTLAVFKADKENISDEYCYQFFKSREKEISQKNTGAAIPHANKSYIIGMDIVVPAKNVLNSFSERLIPITELIENLYTQIQNLKEARDILLPRLMNGEIDVEATIHELEEA